MKKLALFLCLCLISVSGFSQQNVGIGTNNPKSKVDVTGNITIGSGYSGTNAAPANGAIIQGQVGVGTATPDASTTLDITSTTKGVSFPNVTLTGAGTQSPIASPKTGLIVYNTGTSFGVAGLYINNGTPSSPNWIHITDAGSAVGSVTATSPLQNTGTSTSPNIALTGVVPITLGGTGSSSVPVAGQLLIGNGLGSYSINTISPATNQTTVNNGVGTITVGTAQDIATTSSPTFANPTVTTLTANGANQNSISATGSVKVGSTTATAAAAGAGAIKYNSGIQYSDGTNWNTLSTSTGTVTAVTASSPLSSTGGTAPNITLSGTVPVANGGTGATTGAGALTNLGAAPASGSANYIQNGTASQTASFNVTGTGYIGGNAGVGSTSPAGKLSVITTSSDGNVAAWGTGQMTVGQDGTTAGALGLSYSTANNAGYISSLAPSVLWKDLGFRASNTIFYYNGSTEGMRLNTSGNLGIGTNSPGDAFHISRAEGSSTPGLGVSASGGLTGNAKIELRGGSPYIDFANNASATDYDMRLLMNTPGNLQLYGGTLDMTSHKIISVTDPTNAQDAATKNYVDTKVTGSVAGTTNYISKFTGTNSLGISQLFDNGTNVAIGTTTPAAGAALHLYADRYAVFGPNSTWSSYLRVGGNGGNIDNLASVATTNGNLHLDASAVGPGNAMYLNYYKGVGGIYFGTGAGTAHSFFSAAGNLGIGSMSPAGKLSVITASSDGSVAAWGTGQMTVGQDGTTAGALGFSYSTTNNAGYISALAPAVAWKDLGFRAANTYFYYNGVTEGMRLNTAGNVGIGTTAPSVMLDVNGVVNSATGFEIAHAATTGNYLRGNGTNFVSSAIQAADIPAGSANYIQNQTSSNQSGGFEINGVGILNSFPANSGAAGDLQIGCTSANCWTANHPNGTIGFAGYGAAHGQIAFYPNFNALAFLSSSCCSPGGDMGALSMTGLSFVDLWANNGYFKGNVGIGISNPSDLLEIGGTPADGQVVTLRTYSNTPASWKGGAAFGYSSATVIMGELGGVAQIGGHNSTISAWANLALNSGGGNVGIGTTTPQEKLDVNGNIEMGYNQANSVYLHKVFATAHSTSNVPYTIGLSASDGCGEMGVAVNGVRNAGNTANDQYITFSTHAGGVSCGERMRITQTGTVGVGTTAPISTFQTAGTLTVGSGSSANAIGIAQITTGGASPINNRLTYGTDGTGWKFAISKNQGGTVTDQLTVQDNGNVGIATTSPTQALEVNGNFKVDGGGIFSGQRTNFELALQSDRNMVLYDNSGAVWASGTSTSDIRTKTNIRPLEDVLPDLMALSTIRFNYKKELDLGNEEHIGVIAQEIAKYYPDMVYYDKKADRYLVYYDKLSTVLLKGLQELKTQVDDLRCENNELKVKVETGTGQQDLMQNDIESLKNETRRLKSSKADAMDVNQLKAQVDELKTLMEKNGIRTEK